MGCILLGGRTAIGYDQGYGGAVFYLVLAVDEKYVGGFVEGGPERIEEEQHFWNLFEEEAQGEVVKGKPQGRLRGQSGEACRSLRLKTFVPVGEVGSGGCL